MQLDGSWWLPGSSEGKIRGTLEESGEWYVLALDSDISDANPNFFYEVDAIFGDTRAGRVTLGDAFRKSVGPKPSDGKTGNGPAKYASRDLFMGQHLPNPAETLVTSIAIRHPELFYWFQQMGLKYTRDQQDKESFTVTYSPPTPVEVFANEMTISLQSVLVEETHGFSPVLLEFREEIEATVSFQKPLPLKEATARARIEGFAFLSFVTGLNLTRSSRNTITLISDETYKLWEGVAKVRREPKPQTGAEKSDTSNRDKILVPFDVVKGADDILRNWQVLVAKVPHVIDLLMSVTFSDRQFVDQQLRIPVKTSSLSD